jgi:hypothetical protein
MKLMVFSQQTLFSGKTPEQYQVCVVHLEPHLAPMEDRLRIAGGT